MLTFEDFEKLKEIFVTKDYLHNYVDPRFEKIEHLINDRFDKLMKELIELRRERVTDGQEHDDVRIRLDAIESLPTISKDLNPKLSS